MNDGRTPRPHFLDPTAGAELDRLRQLCRDQQPDLREIAARINELAPLAQLVLQAANASSLGLQRAVSSPERAVAVLGVNRIAELVERCAARIAGAVR